MPKAGPCSSTRHSTPTATVPSPQANLLFVKELARRLKEEGSAVEAFALHPGGPCSLVLRTLICSSNTGMQGVPARPLNVANHIRKMGPCWIGVGGHCFNANVNSMQLPTLTLGQRPTNTCSNNVAQTFLLANCCPAVDVGPTLHNVHPTHAWLMAPQQLSSQR